MRIEKSGFKIKLDVILKHWHQSYSIENSTAPTNSVLFHQE
jgi:hypothetical protein